MQERSVLGGAKEVLVNPLEPGEQQTVTVMQQAPRRVSGQRGTVLRLVTIARNVDTRPCGLKRTCPRLPKESLTAPPIWTDSICFQSAWRFCRDVHSECADPDFGVARYGDRGQWFVSQ